MHIKNDIHFKVNLLLHFKSPYRNLQGCWFLCDNILAHFFISLLLWLLFYDFCVMGQFWSCSTEFFIKLQSALNPLFFSHLVSHLESTFRDVGSCVKSPCSIPSLPCYCGSTSIIFVSWEDSGFIVQSSSPQSGITSSLGSSIPELVATSARIFKDAGYCVTSSYFSATSSVVGADCCVVKA